MSIKRVKRDAVFELVSVKDDAIDLEKSDTKAYKKTLDTGHLVFKEGQKPTLFLVKGMPHLRRAELDDEHVKVELPEDPDQLEAMQKGGAGAPKPKVRIERQSELTVKYFEECVQGVKEFNGTEYVETKGVRAEEFSGDVVQDIGDQCQVLSRLGEPLKKP